MDGREAMTLTGSASYYHNRGLGGSGGSGPTPNVHTSVFKNLSNPNIPLQHSNVGGGVSGSTFHVENPSPNFSHGMNMAMAPIAPQGVEPVKKKRGRPRKYAPEGANMSLALSPTSASKPHSEEITPGEKVVRRGRPPGSGWKQKLAPLDDHVGAGNTNEELPQASSHIKKVKNLSNDERQAIYNMLQQKSDAGYLTKGVTRMVASQFSVSIRTVQRIWRQSENGHTHADVSHRKTRNCGRKRVQINFDQIREIPLHQRTTLDSLACSLNINKSTLFRRLKSGEIRRHSNAIKPFLKEENKRARLQFCISMLEGDSIPHDPIFIGMYNIVHIDEKWFYMTKKSENYYLLPDEEDPLRTCKSKNFIGKVMFLVAIARPRFDAQGNELFSGKIGVFPFVTHEPAKRTSINRVAGTLETKPITSVKKDVVRSYLIEKVIPSIKEKWPREDSRCPIFIQQDNARTHIDHNDDQFCRAATQDGFDIRLMSQPPNSPDLNVLDLGFFSGIQSLQYKESVKTVDELVSAVEKSFQAFPTTKSNRIFLTLQSCMIEIMRAKGSHKYKIPHVKKAMLERLGQLPTQLKCDAELVQEVLNYLS